MRVREVGVLVELSNLASREHIVMNGGSRNARRDSQNR